MRQAGILAAGALYALENNVERLKEDHDKAQRIATVVQETPGLNLPDTADTNMVVFEVSPEMGTAADFAKQLRDQGVAMFDIGKQLVRAVTHSDVSLGEVDQACTKIQEIAQSMA